MAYCFEILDGKTKTEYAKISGTCPASNSNIIRHHYMKNKGFRLNPNGLTRARYGLGLSNYLNSETKSAIVSLRLD